MPGISYAKIILEHFSCPCFYKKISQKYVNSLICIAVPVYLYWRDVFTKEMEKFSRVDFTLQDTRKYWNN